MSAHWTRLVPDAWEEGLAVEHLASDEVQVWRIVLDAQGDELRESIYQTLSADERERANRFVFLRDRRRFAICRSALRELLGRYLNVPAERIEFAYGPYGKPELAGPLANLGWHFNVAHSEEVAVVAVARQPVGVDVEALRPGVAGPEIAARYFSPGEVADLMSLAEEQRELAFFRCWTRKEAYIKARGLGLSIGLASFRVSLMPGAAAELLADTACSEVSRWRMAELVPAVGYVGAVTCKGAFRLKRGSWQSDNP